MLNPGLIRREVADAWLIMAVAGQARPRTGLGAGRSLRVVVEEET